MQYSVFVKLEPYLGQWFVNKYGGSVPVVLERGCTESRFIEASLDRMPSDAVPKLKAEEGEVEIILPHYKAFDVETYNYLSPTDLKMLHDVIREAFLLNLDTDYLKVATLLSSRKGPQKQDWVESWMRKHGIVFDDTNFNTVLKILRRLHDSKRRSILRMKNKKK